MTLSSGGRLGPYEIVGPLGAGGMGEVYRARDTRLGRDVAIKVLPERLRHDPEALGRFEREARAVAALSHPNLLALHDVGREHETAYAVMELLDGETLRARIQSGLLPVRRAIDYASQIVQGLAAAHEKGIVHRDLKPENLFLTTDGRVKILDFGLAAQRPPSAAEGESSPTQTRHTEPGQVLGTVGYMSPEQVSGRAADTRSDIFSFGVVLYEMLSGRRPFQRETAAETMTAILREDPPDLVSGRDEIPAVLVQIVYRCLEKDPAARASSARDLAFDMRLVTGLSTGRAGSRADHRGVSAWQSRWGWTAAAMVGGAAIATLGLLALGSLRRIEPPRVVRLSMTLPPTLALNIGGATVADGLPALALSPDGRHIIYRAHAAFPSDARLYLRSLREAEARPIDGTETAVGPFFSFDGRSVAFFDTGDSQFKRIPLTGGAARPICGAESPIGSSWGEDGSIVLAPKYNGGLSRVSSQGGRPEPLTTLDNRAETSHAYPQVLPGGKAVLFTVEVPGRPWDDARLVIQDLTTGRRSVAVEGGCGGRYVRTGHILYGRRSSLMAVPFDLERREASGPSVTMIGGVSTNAGTGAVQFDVSDDGTLVYVSRGSRSSERTLVWVDRRGVVAPATATGAHYLRVDVSPDGRRVAAEIYAADNDIWLLDLTSGALTRRTFDHENHSPLWAPDGRRLLFRSDRDGSPNVYALPAEAAGQPRRLTTAPFWQRPTSIAKDGSALLFDQTSGRGDQDVWMLPLRGEGKPVPIAETAFNESGASLSPDRAWIAYQSDESGRPEIYIQPFPGPGGKQRISLDGGTHPAWSPDGRELFFQQGPKLMACRVSASPSFSPSRPELAFEAPWILEWTVARDGRFLVVRSSEEETSTREIHVILNFGEELKRRAPTAAN